ncbi:MULTISPECIES: type II 3-dehydroquinate dehydratase [Tepidanaerobacter]|uniref:3-dehydroquinate dehydratase n=1 Tax=Tepidanaerobacter syntrophicus TaxID=224999 RepID=A0A0U9HG30_9FIRM|nr:MULTISPECIES: type II 3-dehydroquinate dehydratase [Tepidanaerobacter]GAQ25726.1 3-dehydroquinate dehydratase-2 [Tepidanaerobacter syntrophicus]GLI20096.1 3-dehydroquinate dehydratase [Tepidanaerobacter syntrophicus]GLI51463.1 3-dehydroquinate dehydratase [Tepidanaerobacter syntrophicus]HHV82312.1 type II 3-dehydroquinate dehydratase [Tepidanaerobacter syntrophicus]
MNITIINGPNINMLGIRERDVYGIKSYEEACDLLYKAAKEMDISLAIVQSNSEGEIIDYIQKAYGKFDGIIINPGAYTHYSIAIYDAIKSVSIPAIEVHISNIHAREEFRRKSVTAGACIGQICGFGIYGYIMAMLGLKDFLSGKG